MPKHFLGLRIAVPSVNNKTSTLKLSGDYMLGIILGSKGGKHQIELDSGMIKSVSKDNVLAVSNFEDNKKPVSYTKLIESSFDFYEQWASTKQRKMGLASMKGMWLRINSDVFGNKLIMPVLKIFNTSITLNGKKHSTANGLFQYTRPYGKLFLSKKVKSPKGVLNVIAHEMCHQAQFLLDKSDIGGHGKDFFKWGNLVKNKIGLIIRIKDDGTEGNKVEHTEGKKVKPMYVVALYFKKLDQMYMTKEKDMPSAREASKKLALLIPKDDTKDKDKKRVPTDRAKRPKRRPTDRAKIIILKIDDANILESIPATTRIKASTVPTFVKDYILKAYSEENKEFED